MRYTRTVPRQLHPPCTCNIADGEFEGGREGKRDNGNQDCDRLDNPPEMFLIVSGSDDQVH